MIQPEAPLRRSLPITVPWTGEEEVEEIRTVLASGHLAQGPKTGEFERMVMEKTGAKFAFATSSCTTALHLSLVALNIQRDHEVLVPDFTFPATANVVVQLGARPVLVDIDPITFTICPEDLRSKITNRSRAVIPVHTFGAPANMGAVNQIAEECGLHVLEDAACALGATYHGRQCGTLSPLGCFSFHPRKSITTGEGGMITTSDETLAKKIALLRSHGGTRVAGRFTFEDCGFNYRMSDLLAAIGVAQMRKLEEIIHRKRKLGAQLSASLRNMDGVSLPNDPTWGTHTYQSFVIRLAPDLDRDAIIPKLRELGVETTIGTYALHREPAFSGRFGYRIGDIPNSNSAFEQTLTLPLHPQMIDEDLRWIASAIRSVI